MKIFYGWRIVFAGGALQFLQNLLLNMAFGAYVAVLVEERGWSKTALAGAAALKSTESAILGPVLGWMLDRFGAQGMIRAGIVPSASASCCSARSTRWSASMPRSSILALGSSMCSNFPVSVAIIQWFEKRRARALSALQFGSALGGIFVVCGRLVDSSVRLARDSIRLRRHRHPRRLAAGASDQEPARGSRRNDRRTAACAEGRARRRCSRRGARSRRAKHCERARSG